MTAPFWALCGPLYGAERLEGYTEEEIASLKERFGALPQVLEDYYRAAGRTGEFHCVQDSWILPEDYQRWDWLRESEYMVLLNENQGVCRAGIRREDLSLPDPPVYSTEDDQDWVLCAPALSEFLPAVLAYEAAFAPAYSPEEFYWLTEEEIEELRASLTELPFSFENWISWMKVTLYQNAPDNIVAVMECEDGELQMLYGAASEASYTKLLTVLEGVGEPL